MSAPSLPVEAEAALRRFRAFYEELFTVKQMLRDGDWGALVGERALPGTVEEQLPRAVQLRLRRAIAAQGYAGMPSAGAPSGVDPGYVMAAVADEALLHEVAWPGAEAWAETPLEHILYRSRIAGDRIFRAVDALATTRHPDPEGIAMTILLALETGFRGRYSGEDDRGRIAEDRQRLFSVIFRSRFAAQDDPGALLAGATEPLTGRPTIRLPQLRPWLLALAGAAIVYLLLSWIIWAIQVSDVVATARHITSTTQLVR